MNYVLILVLGLGACLTPATADATVLKCSPDAGQQTYFIGGKAQTAPSEVTAEDGFEVVIDGGGRPDIIWNKEQWGFKSARAGSIDIKFLQKSDIMGDFGLTGGGANLSYLLHVNADDAGVKRYVLTMTTYVGSYAVVTEAGVCRKRVI